MIDLGVIVQRFSWLFRLQFVLAIAIFTYFTLSPDPGLNTGGHDKVWHFTGNFLLFLSARLALLRLNHPWFVLVFVLLYGVAVEFIQYLVPQRSFDMQDLLANALGVLAGASLALLIQRWLKRRYPSPAADDHAQP